MTDLKQYGSVQRAMLGCTITELDSKLAKEKGITVTKSGLMVMEVTDRSTAKEIGLQSGDVIVGINDAEIHTFPELQEQLNKFRPGDQISVTYIRDNKKYTKSATLRNSQGSTAITKKGDFSEIGCAFMKIGEETKRNLGISNGVKVTGLKGGAFRDAGIKDGFIITEINGNRVNSSDDVEMIYNQIMKSGESDKVMFITGLYPTGKKYYYAVNLAQE